MVGPIRATNAFSRFWCDLWMLFPTEEEYIYWFKSAGFRQIEVSEITPEAYKGVRRHGLIMGLVVTGIKPVDGPELPLSSGDDIYEELAPEEQTRSASMSLALRLKFLLRQILGTIAGFYYFVLPLLVIAYAAIFIRRREQAQNA